MAFSVVQAGASLQFINELGEVSTLTLPTGITLRTDVPPRWGVSDRYVVLVNTPSQPLIIDGAGVVRLLSPRPPRIGAVLSGVGSGTLSGTYGHVRYTFVTLDLQGNIISESDYSPESNTATIAAQYLKAASLDISPDQITLRRMYRPTNGGAVLFQWFDLDGNVLTAAQDDLSDAKLSLIASPTLGTPPHLTHIGSFRDRLWGVGSDDPDSIRYTESGTRWSWPEDNLIPIPPVGADEFGVIAVVPRREALGIGRNKQFIQITGTAKEFNDEIDLDVVVLSTELGVSSQESVTVFRDVAYFLWKDGVYSWDSSGFKCISDSGNVRSWFTTDTYFNRGRFANAFAVFDERRYKYRLYLASVGSTKEDRWVEYDIKTGNWWGPHKTDAFNPVSSFVLSGEDTTNITVTGSDDSFEADIYEEQEDRHDSDATPIDFNVVGKRHDSRVPDYEKYFGQISMVGKAETAGTLDVRARCGDLNKITTTLHQYDMTLTRQRLSNRAGKGKHLQLELFHKTIDQLVELYGYEVNPVNLIGRR